MNEARMTEFVEKAICDVGALLGGSLVVIGDKLGLYRAMAGPVGSARRTWPAAPAPPSGTCASGRAHKRHAAT
ncbi:hypothetical protein [Terrabacter sp. 2YAF2]|uniref:hypothetical protein n=1 Tax=Terrabacter sp. 2YAF2 TaxID=3233026 RepID=UPI003F960E0A